MKKPDKIQLFLIAGIIFMSALIIIGRPGFEMETSNNDYPVGAIIDFETDSNYYSLETGANIFRTLITLPSTIWNMIWQPTVSQMQFFIRDGFSVFGASNLIPVVVDDVEPPTQQVPSADLYMMTWTPAPGFVRHVNSDAPLVYFFNSHPWEMIGAPSHSDPYNGTVNILEYTHQLAHILNDFNIPSFVEERDIRTIKPDRGWLFNDSYHASEVFLLENIRQHDTLEFFFDIHRDHVPDQAATATINGTTYARIAFVISLDNPSGYEPNMIMAQEIMALLEAKRPGITRPIVIFPISTIQNHLNQQHSENLQLLEIGAAQSTPEEMDRTIRVLGEVIAEYITNVRKSR